MRPTPDFTNLHYFDPAWIRSTRDGVTADVCVYGGTAAGVVAAVKAARLGLQAVVLQPGRHLGGMTTGGLGWTDYGRKHVIGGMARQFYRDVGRFYGKDEEWHFEPRAAEHVIEGMAATPGIRVIRFQYLDRAVMDGRRIAALIMRGGLTVTARAFIDATYEGDLLAAAGVSYAVGREANSVYGETLNGIQVRNLHQFSHPVDPHVIAGDPASGLLPQIENDDLSLRQGEGDRRVQAYNFRMCMTDDPALKIEWPCPADFDPRQYVLATRWYQGDKDAYNESLPKPPSEPGTVPLKFDVLPNPTAGGGRKTDTNNHGPVSSDFIGANHAWPEGDYAVRERIFQRHVTYQMGFYWHMANSPDVPDRYRRAFQRWGLPSNEFVDTGHWPHQIYVREARRMVADYVITEADCRGTSRPDDPIGMASYTMDSHNCTRFAKLDGGRWRVLNEGDVQVPPTDPYPVSYRAIVPRRGECENLLVPVCMSASHIAYGSARMEPVFMALGESAAVAASLALERGCPVQAVPHTPLRDALLAAGQILALPGRRD